MELQENNISVRGRVKCDIIYLKNIMIFYVHHTSSGNVHLPPWTDEWRARGRGRGGGRGGRGPGHRRRHAVQAQAEADDQVLQRAGGRARPEARQRRGEPLQAPRRPLHRHRQAGSEFRV